MEVLLAIVISVLFACALRKQAGMIASFVVSSLLIVLLAALTVTSFNAVKTRMSSDAWKRLQKTAYVFFGLVYVHLMLMLAPAASRGGEAAVASVAVCTVVFGAYAALRVRRAFVDRRAVAAVGAPDAASGFDLETGDCAV